MSHLPNGLDAYVVSTQLDTGLFDRRAAARATVRAVMAEVKQIEQADWRVRGVKLRRVRGTRGYSLDLVIAADDGWAAFEIGSAVVRSAIHAAGGSTALWEQIQPTLVGSGTMRRATPSSWAEAAAAATRRAAANPALRPFDGPMAGVAVIDLR